MDGFVRMLFDEARGRVTVTCRFCQHVLGKMRGKPPSYFPETQAVISRVCRAVADHFHGVHPDQWKRLSRIARRWGP